MENKGTDDEAAHKAKINKRCHCSTYRCEDYRSCNGCNTCNMYKLVYPKSCYHCETDKNMIVRCENSYDVHDFYDPCKTPLTLGELGANGNCLRCEALLGPYELIPFSEIYEKGLCCIECGDSNTLFRLQCEHNIHPRCLNAVKCKNIPNKNGCTQCCREEVSKTRVPLQTVILSGRKIYSCGFLGNPDLDSFSNELTEIPLLFDVGEFPVRTKICGPSGDETHLLVFTNKGQVYVESGLIPSHCGSVPIPSKTRLSGLRRGKIVHPKGCEVIVDVVIYEYGRYICDDQGSLWYVSNAGLLENPDAPVKKCRRLILGKDVPHKIENAANIVKLWIFFEPNNYVLIASDGDGKSFYMETPVPGWTETMPTLFPIRGEPRNIVNVSRTREGTLLFLGGGDVWYFGRNQRPPHIIYAAPALDDIKKEFFQSEPDFRFGELYASVHLSLARSVTGGWCVRFDKRGSLIDGTEFPYGFHHVPDLSGCELLFFGGDYALFALPPTETRPADSPNVLAWGMNTYGSLGIPHLVQGEFAITPLLVPGFVYKRPSQLGSFMKSARKRAAFSPESPDPHPKKFKTIQ